MGRLVQLKWLICTVLSLQTVHWFQTIDVSCVHQALLTLPLNPLQHPYCAAEPQTTRPPQQMNPVTVLLHQNIVEKFNSGGKLPTCCLDKKKLVKQRSAPVAHHLEAEVMLNIQIHAIFTTLIHLDWTKSWSWITLNRNNNMTPDRWQDYLFITAPVSR